MEGEKARGALMMKIPATRKDRVQWIARKFGQESVMVWAIKTDREVKKEFESLYRLYKG
ncbi:hypothetical protein D3C74_91810 [compost metagenome]